MTQLVELKQNRTLLQTDFPGYKLSLQDIPKLTINLSSKVNIVEPNNEQYTFKHAKLFSLHNHILASEVDELEGTEAIYYIGDDRLIYKIESDILGLEEKCMNWEVPFLDSNYNCTMVFPDKNFAVVSNGSRNIYILDRKDEWRCIYNETNDFSCVILDSKIFQNVLHLILFAIVADNEETSEKRSEHKSVIYWVQYECCNGIWSRKSIEEMQSRSELHYAFLSTDTNLYIVSSDGGFVNEDNDGLKNTFFTWSQTDESVTIYMLATIAHIVDQQITIKNKEEIVLDEILYDKIDSSQNVIINDGGITEIMLYKETAAMWPELIQSKPSLGEYQHDPKTAKNILKQFVGFLEPRETFATKQSTLTDQIEDCDFATSKWSLIERITPEKIVSHRVLHTQEIVFVDSALQQFAVHQNDDICIYQPCSNYEWNLEHTGTLFALGYVRASKLRRKFTTCAPDLSYSIIAEGGRHIFVYRQNVDVTSGELRHRRSGRHVKQLALQQVIELEADDNIWGVKASNTVLFVLSEHKVHVFKMN